MQSGDRVGRWTVLSEQPRTHKTRYFLCRCDCGTERNLQIGHLRRGETLSCGCQRLELWRQHPPGGLKHGGHKFPEYYIWQAMIQRCHNTKHPMYAYWGGRGIIVCERWRTSFEAFYADMGPRPSPKHQIDRWPDMNGNYEAGNCRWATIRQQALNKRSARLVTYKGITRHLTEWAEWFGIHASTLGARLDRGTPFLTAVTAPVRAHHRHS